jgi:hypothetical protein
MTSLTLAVALGGTLALGGCGEARRTIAEYPVAESPAAAAAPYPALVDMPTPRAAREAAPDHAVGAAVAGDLRRDAAVQAAESERLSAPVFDVAPLREAGAEARRGR